MQPATHRTVSFVLAVCAVFATGWSASAWGKSCWDLVIPVQDDPAEFVDGLSTIVFVGTAVQQRREAYASTENADYVSAEDTIFSVDTVVKGNIAVDDRVVVVGRLGDCTCVRGFELGKRYRVVATLSEIDGADRFAIKYCDDILEIEN